MPHSEASSAPPSSTRARPRVYAAKNLVESDRCFGFAIDEAIRRGVDVAVISGDSTDHALDVHAPAVERLARQVWRLADHCPVLMLQGTFSHEPLR